MSGLGMLASAIGGAAGVVGQQAAGDIEQGRKVDLATEQANIEAQMRMRVAEAQESIRQRSVQADIDIANKPDNVAAQVATASTKAVAAGKTAQDVEQSALGNTGLQTTRREVAAANTASTAAAEAQAKADATKKFGTDQTFLAATKAITNASHYFGPQEQLAVQQLSRIKKVEAIRDLLANTKDFEKRDELQTQLNDLEGKGLTRKDAAVALTQTENAIAKARAILSDPLAKPEAIDSANESIATLKLSAAVLAKQVTGKDAPKAPDPIKAAMDAARAAKGGDKGGDKNAKANVNSNAQQNGSSRILKSTDPILARVAAENREINDLKRTAYSPEVQQYLDQQDAAKSQAARSTSDDYKARELKRQQDRARGY